MKSLSHVDCTKFLTHYVIHCICSSLYLFLFLYYSSECLSSHVFTSLGDCLGAHIDRTSSNDVSSKLGVSFREKLIKHRCSLHLAQAPRISFGRQRFLFPSRPNENRRNVAHSVRRDITGSTTFF